LCKKTNPKKRGKWSNFGPGLIGQLREGEIIAKEVKTVEQLESLEDASKKWGVEKVGHHC
jgi:hypothetical protein